jgi:Asp-tRNA(Asn)/Glu-tRNA(Gln) amidotransferase A subunit family amidase
MSAVLDLTAAEAAARVRAGDLDPAELWHVYRERAAADDLNAFTWVSDYTDPPPANLDGPLAGVPLGPARGSSRGTGRRSPPPRCSG